MRVGILKSREPVLNFVSYFIFELFMDDSIKNSSILTKTFSDFQLCHINFQGDDRKDAWTAEDHRKWNEDWYRRDSANSYGTE
jgi:hypothetical protein